uniref:Uncharacterized protein n=1 Tax=Anguilla anguilla TaxID=7936 RepID=A0A0E9PT51_ANGAN
MPDIYCAARGW